MYLLKTPCLKVWGLIVVTHPLDRNSFGIYSLRLICVFILSKYVAIKIEVQFVRLRQELALNIYQLFIKP